MAVPFPLLKKYTNSPLNECTYRFPNRTPWRELPASRTSFYVPLRFLNKSSPDRKIAPFLQSPWERNIPSMFPKAGPLWKQTPISTAILNTPFRNQEVYLSLSP
jgi:hypothetical protein